MSRTPDTRCRQCQQGDHHICKNTRICPCAKRGHPTPEPGFQKIDLPRAIDILRRTRDDPNTPMHVAADISQVLVECLDDRDEEF